MRHVLCDLCGADDSAVIARTGRLRLPVRTVICRRCGLVYTDPVLELEDYSPEDAEKVRRLRRPAARPSEKYLAKNQRRADGALAILEPILCPGMRALDVGCAAGTLLAALRERGCEVTGVEPEPAFAAYSRDERGLRVHECLLEEADLPPGTFHLVTLSHVLEHADSPRAFIGRLRELLADGGWLFIEVPNVLEPRCSSRRIFHVAHKTSFTPTTLRRMVERAGFRIEATRLLNGPGTVQMLAEKAEASHETGTPEDWRAVVRRLRRHRYMYYVSGMFIRRKLGAET